jgi:hypothetical protein
MTSIRPTCVRPRARALRKDCAPSPEHRGRSRRCCRHPDPGRDAGLPAYAGGHGHRHASTFPVRRRKFNAEELDRRRDDYAYLKQQRRAGATLQDHLDRPASFARFGDAADEALIESVRVPGFLRQHGSFKGDDALKALSVWPLGEMQRLSADDTAQWQRVRSRGLVDAIRWTWGNDRPDLEPGRAHAVISVEQAGSLDSRYTVIGRWTCPRLEGSGHLYFDGEGRSGIFHYHQDESPVHRLSGDSPARMTWDKLMNAALTEVLDPDGYG